MNQDHRCGWGTWPPTAALWDHFEKMDRNKGQGRASEATLWRSGLGETRVYWRKALASYMSERHCSAAPVPSLQSLLGPPIPSQHSPSILLFESKPLLPISQSSYERLVISALNRFLFLSLHPPLLKPVSIKGSHENHQQFSMSNKIQTRKV